MHTRQGFLFVFVLQNQTFFFPSRNPIFMSYNISVMIKDSSFFSSHKAEHVFDSLTNLVNKEYFIKYMKNLAERNVMFTLFMIDFDNFKKINDTYGHPVGDMVLQDTAKILEEEIGAKGVIGRYSDDEFGILIPNITIYNDVWDIARNYHQKVRKTCFPYLSNPNVSGITVTSGICRFPIDAKTTEELLVLSDKALYRGKTKGKNCFIIYNRSLHGDIDIEHKKADLSFSGFMDYLFGNFMTSEPTQAMVKSSHIVGNYYGDKNIYYISKDDCTPLYSSLASEKKDPLPSLRFAAYHFSDKENFRIYYHSRLSHDDDIYLKMKERNVRSVLLIRFEGASENDLLLCEAEQEKIFSDEEVILLKMIARLFCLTTSLKKTC